MHAPCARACARWPLQAFNATFESNKADGWVPTSYEELAADQELLEGFLGAHVVSGGAGAATCIHISSAFFRPAQCSTGQPTW